MTQTEHVARQLARSALTIKGKAAFDSGPTYWKQCFSMREREDYRRLARVAIRALRPPPSVRGAG